MAEVKILYAVQATGNGHLARAKEVLPQLQQHGDVDLLVSGTQGDLQLGVPPRFRFDGLTFTFGRDGGIDMTRTLRDMVLPQLKLRALREFLSIPIHEYSWVLHDFEPITAWRSKTAGVFCTQLSHQASFQSPRVPRPETRDLFAEFVMQYFAVADRYVGLHYRPYDTNIRTPIIRRAVRELETRNDGHITVYLPAYSDERLVPLLKQIPHVEWQLFNKHHRESYVDKNVRVSPVHEARFLESFASSDGLLTGAGFQATSEAIYLKKRLIVVPMRQQYEQHCNAAALRAFGVPSLPEVAPRTLEPLRQWLADSKPVELNFPDETAEIVRDIVVHADNFRR